MAKILISWLGVEKDMLNDKLANTNGPTWNFYKYYYKDFKINQHILLVTTNMLHRAKHFARQATDYFGFNIKILPVEITGVHYDLAEIKTKVENILMQYRDNQILIFFSTGSAIMKIAWYLLHTSLGLNTQVLQIIRKEESQSPDKPDLFILNFEKSSIPYSVLIREQSLKSQQKSQKPTPIITKSLESIYDKALQVAQTDNISVLILGETGTGKEELARYIHQNSIRRNKPFAAINCAAFTDELLESRLFGHAKGSFTGAYSDSKGLFEQANGGTVFLDEIGDISPYMQQALLRFLENGEIQPIGKSPKKVDVRIIAATNKDVNQLLNTAKFRSDLFFRLGVILELPPLRTFSNNEKLSIIDHLLSIKAQQFKRNKLSLCKELKTFLLTYRFPGNFRELINLIEHLYIFAQDGKACTEHLPYHITYNPITFTKLKDVEREHIIKIYHMFNKNLTQTAQALGISINTLKSKLKSYGLRS